MQEIKKDKKIINIKVIPNASKNEIIKQDNFYKIKITAVPEKGKANKLLIKILADYFNVSKKSIIIQSGEKSKNKVIEIG